MKITNKYENKCTKCNKLIPIDTEVDWIKGTGISHIECPVLLPKTLSALREILLCDRCKADVSSGDKYMTEYERICETCFDKELVH